MKSQRRKNCVSCAKARTISLNQFDRAQVLEPLETRRLLSAATIIAENMLPGTPESTWEITGGGDPTIQGFTTDISVNHGSTISFKINDTKLAAYEIDVYRIGYYGGDGVRLVTTLSGSQVTKTVQPAPVMNAQTGLVDAGNWSVSASWAVPATAVSGLYVANVKREDTGGESPIYFIVRADESHSAVLFKTSDTTWEAYNAWDYSDGLDDGNSLYTGTSIETLGQPLQRAVEVSYNRPLVVSGVDGGLGSYNAPLFAEYPMIRFMEKNGYDVTYISSLDADRSPGLLLNHQILLSVGHDEYWSANERTAFDAARNAGVSICFFSGNEVYWKIYFAPSTDSSATPNRTIVCYKDTHAQAFTTPSGIWTGQWRDSRFGATDAGLPENELTGQLFTVNQDINPIGTAIQVPAQFANLRIWRDTSVATLQAGQVATLAQGTLGYEWDSDVDNGFRPAGLVDLSLTSHVVPQKLIDRYSGYGSPCPNCPGIGTAGCGCVVGQDTATHSLTMYRASGGGLVFGAGTVQWSWGLDSDHLDANEVAGGAQSDVRMQQATINIFADMGVSAGSLMSGLVQTTASTDHTPPVTAITSLANGATVGMGGAVTVSGTAFDQGGGVVAGVEISTDGGQTWHPAIGTSNWSYSWTPPASGQYNILVRATDDSYNTSQPEGILVSVAGGPVGQTVFGEMAPADVVDADTSSIEVGMKFQTDLPGTVTGVRFYKFASNTGTHTGTLWSSTGQELATVTFTNETAVGWQYAAFSAPVSIQADTTYVISYHTTVGQYAADAYYFTSTRPMGSQDVTALNNTVTGGNGVYTYASSTAFPTSTFDGTNYYVDVVFQPTADHTPPAVLATTPTPGSTAVSTSAPITAFFSESINPATLTFSLINAANQLIAGNISYNDSTHTATFTPTSPLAGNTVYTATVSASDISGNAMPSPVTWSFTTGVVDITPPSISARTPASAATGVPNDSPISVTFSEPVRNDSSLTLTLKNSSSQTIAASLIYDPTDNTATLTPTSPLALSTKYTVTAGATDLAGNVMTPASWSFTTAATTTFSIWSTSTTPTNTSEADPAAVEVGTKFVSSVSGFVTGVRFYKGSGNTGTHVGHLWTTSGVLLATVTFTNETASGWQTANFSTPVAVNANTTYIISYYAPNGHYADDDSYFVDNGVTNGPLTALSNVNGGNGVFAYATGGAFPTQSWESDNFWVDVLFASSITDTTPPSITARTPASGATGVATNSTITAQFSESVKSDSSLSITLKNGSTTIPGTLSYIANTDTATFTPSSPLSTSTTYSVTVTATDLSGNVMSPATWSFTTAAAPGAAPMITAFSPANGASSIATNSAITASFNKAIQTSNLLFSVTDTSDGNASVAGAVTYTSASSTATFTPTTALAYESTYTVSVLATDTGGDVMPLASSWHFTTGAAPTGTLSIFSSSQTPTLAADTDSSSVEVGMKFTSDVAGTVTGVKFYKGTGNTGTHIGHLWTSTGTLLASVTFTNETTTGWQTANFSTPVAISANTVYVVSYFAPKGHYAGDTGYFTAGQITSGPLHALQDGADGGNGVYTYGSTSVFPSSTWEASNYWVDVLFTAGTPGTPPGPSTTLNITMKSPASGATSVPVSSTVSAVFSGPITASSLSLTRKNSSGSLITATVTYNATTQTATLTPTAAFSTGQTYTATIVAADSLGDEMNPVSWSFGT